MLSGDNGILTKAADSKKMTEIADAKEQAQLDILAWQSEKISKGENSDLNDSIVKGILTGKSYVKTANDTSFITANGEHEILYSDLYTKTTPTGPKAGESGYAGGYYDDPYIPVGFEHTGNDDWNSGYTIIGKTGTDNAGDEFVWVPCSADTVPPSGVVKFCTINSGKYAYNGGPPITEWNQEQTGIDIKSSVQEDGVFYIAKYEAGIQGTKDNYTLYTESGNNSNALTSTSTKALSQSGKGIWNYISRDDAKSVAQAMVTTSAGSKSALISGECWDTTLQWIKNTTDENYDEISAGKGNYNEDENEEDWKGTLTTTGKISNYSKNNIYDMAGNIGEWTTEYGSFSGSNWWVQRGGYWSCTGSSFPASSRLPAGAASNNLGFRVVLYKEASNP